MADAAGIFLADLLILTSNFPLKFFDIYPRMGISEYEFLIQIRQIGVASRQVWAKDP